MELEIYFPPEMKTMLSPYLAASQQITELRFRIGKPIFCYIDGKEQKVYFHGTPVILSKEQMKQLVYHICQYSVYAYEEERKQGYITIKGGHRIGLSGQYITEAGVQRGIRNISGINFRVSHEKKGIATQLLPWCYNKKKAYSMMIISPPGLGKTTLLRELIRNLSNGCAYGDGMNVAVIDERSEIGGSFQGIMQNDLGDRTDCLDGVSKRVGIEMAVRALAPQMLAVDEIGDEKEDEILLEALHCGVKLLLTIHGNNLWDIQQRKLGSKLFQEHVIGRYIEIGMVDGLRTYRIRDEAGKELEVVG